MATKVSFNSVDKIVDQNAKVEQLSINDKDSYFELDDCVSYIVQNDYSKIALQFPDELMTYSTYIASSLKEKTKKKVYVLADTSYGSCCVDEVAASHYDADLVLHFGQSCLTNPGKIPVYYVFGREYFNQENLTSEMKKHFDPDQKVLLLFDVQYNHAIELCKNALQETFQNLTVSSLNVGKKSFHFEEECLKFGRNYSLNGNLEEYKILFIGGNERTLYNVIVSYNRNTVFSYNPDQQRFQKESLSVNKYLMKRFYLIEKAKDAQIVGIVMGTLGVARYNEMVTKLKKTLKDSGKRFYSFVVGKINPAKLANFMEIDIFVLVACPENSLIDSKEFYKPIITPYELEIACLKGREWTGDYLTDFRDLLPGSQHFVDYNEENSEDEPEYSLITGKLRTNNNDSESICTDLATRNESNSLVAAPAKSASEYLATRTWQGLQIQSGKTEVVSAVEGRSGIAMNYVNEPEK